jgi:hypothetical protein
MADRMQIELARDSDAADFERFVKEIGLRAVRVGRTVDILDDSESIGDAATAWLATRTDALVPTRLGDGALALHPPTA